MKFFNIKRVEIQNFRSVSKKVVLDIKPGLYTIEGINNDENGNNGAGKSTIFSSIYWCLTGSPLTNETLADEVINDSAGKNCRVRLTVESDQGEIIITRCRKDDELGNGLYLEINGQDLSCHKVSETQDRLNQLIKIPFELLRSTIMMTHDIKFAFSGLTPQQRVQTLESIRDYSLWDKVRDEANKDIKLFNKKITDNNLVLSNLTGSSDTYSRINSKNEEDLKRIKESFNLESILNRLTELKKNTEVINAKINKEDENLKEYRRISKVGTEEYSEKISKIIEDGNKIKLDNQKLEFSISNLDKEIKTIDKWFTDDKCPTCGKLLDRTESEKEEKNRQKQSLLDEKNVLFGKIEENNKILSVKRKEWSQLNTEYQKLVSKKSEIDGKIEEIERKIQSLNSNLVQNSNEKVKLNSEKDNHEEKVNKLISDIEENKKKIEQIETEKKELEVENNKLNSERMYADFFYKLLGSKGELRPFILNKDIQALNLYMQKYIHVFFKNTEVTLKLNGSAIDIDINSLGIHKTTSRLSGGEQKRLDIAIQFALYDLLRSTSQIQFNLVCFDEIESELDESGIQQIIQIVEDKSSEIESVFWVTNNAMVSENVPHKILCTKSLGVTTIGGELI